MDRIDLAFAARRVLALRILWNQSCLSSGPTDQRARLAERACFEEFVFEPSTIEVDRKEAYLTPLVTLGHRLSHRSLLVGNDLEPFENGDEAYPAMVAAIDQAQKSVAICSFIFRVDNAGMPIIDALVRAKSRGVEVRVLVDGIGSGYLLSPIIRELRRERIPYARFLHSYYPWKMSYINLRSHKKVLVIDGIFGFTGGMNIGGENILLDKPANPVQDVHFKVEGPVVIHLLQTFIDDWSFATGETLQGEKWFPEVRHSGSVIARGMSSGPDEEKETIQMIISGALGRAEDRVRIVTPYFLPDMRLVNIIKLTALRGVEVEIILPSRSNHTFMDWAMTAHISQFIEAGCKVFLSPEPFDHSKLMTIDDLWAFVGSANWDARSLRLNFEFNVECYDKDLSEQINRLIDQKVAKKPPIAIRGAQQPDHFPTYKRRGSSVNASLSLV